VPLLQALLVLQPPWPQVSTTAPFPQVEQEFPPRTHNGPHFPHWSILRFACLSLVTSLSPRLVDGSERKPFLRKSSFLEITVAHPNHHHTSEFFRDISIRSGLRLLLDFPPLYCQRPAIYLPVTAAARRTFCVYNLAPVQQGLDPFFLVNSMCTISFFPFSLRDFVSPSSRPLWIRSVFVRIRR